MAPANTENSANSVYMAPVEEPPGGLARVVLPITPHPAIFRPVTPRPMFIRSGKISLYEDDGG